LKSLMLLWKRTADDLAVRCCTSATMDYKIVQGRVNHEGLSFLTITLANFGKDFQKSLDQGFVARSQYQGFGFKTRTPGSAGLPRFLGGFLERVFDTASGRLLDEPDVLAILAIRQLTLMFSKMELECSDARKRQAFASYIQCEEEVRDSDRRLSDKNMSDFRRISTMLFASIFTKVDREVYRGEVLPKHGPGGTADKLRGNAKFRQSTWPIRLETYFPLGENVIPNWRFSDQLAAVDYLEPEAEIPVKVISVPKTLKTPRIIGMEPTAMQYAQQGLLTIILKELERDYLTDSLLGFDDQTPNQRMAREGSLSGELATLDLSDASDRVSNQLVRALFANHPHLLGAVDACRSRKADVPGWGVQRLAKFASMGSALTFPVEAMVFLTIVILGISRELSLPLNRRTLFKELSGQVRIYGDDIIIPSKWVHTVVRELELFGARVNTSKSYWSGKFRESCGREYYAGQDVSIVKVRQPLPTRRRDATGVISTVSLRNQLRIAGYEEPVEYLDSTMWKVLSHYPRVDIDSPVLGRYEWGLVDSDSYDSDYQIPLVKGWVVSAEPPRNSLDGPGALLKYLIKDSDLPFADPRHLMRSGRPQSVNIKLRKSSNR